MLEEREEGCCVCCHYLMETIYKFPTNDSVKKKTNPEASPDYIIRHRMYIMLNYCPDIHKKVMAYQYIH